MQIPIVLPGLEGHTLALLPGGLLRNPCLLFDGSHLSAPDGQYVLEPTTGEKITLRLQNRFLDPVPAVLVDGRPLAVHPPLRWYQYLWLLLPLLLIVPGGVYGAVPAVMAVVVNARLWRTSLDLFLRFLYSSMVLLAAYLVYRALFSFL
jgi:hypothetical protein